MYYCQDPDLDPDLDPDGSLYFMSTRIIEDINFLNSVNNIGVCLFNKCSLKYNNICPIILSRCCIIRV